MFREITKDHGKRFKKGMVLNYPHDVWKTIAEASRKGGLSIKNMPAMTEAEVKAELDKFSVQVEDKVQNHFKVAQHRMAQRDARGLNISD